MRLGVFGGTFDPPHLGHLLVATDALELLRLDRILLVPNSVQPLKGSAHAAPAERLQMLRLMIGGDTRFEVEPCELQRSGLSYTVDTLEDLASRYPGAKLFFLVGADAARTFQQWRNPERILGLATLTIVNRVDEGIGTADPAGVVAATPLGLPDGAITVATRIIDISSSEIRDRVRKGLPIRGFVTDPVDRYIAEQRLYRQGN